MTEDAVRLVLCMNVKDEAGTIRRCLESALPYVDGYVICDTGSRDDTVALIAAAAASASLPGRVVAHAWRDFGHNRTLAAAEARAWVGEIGWPAERTYLLFLDADMVLHVEPGFDKGSLREPSYALIQDNGTLRYANVRLACLSREWRAIGPTHEYWEPVGEPTRPWRLQSMWIHDLGDGGSKDDKFVRDIRLLRQALAREPTNARYTFYLAQSYFDIGRFAEAAEWYARRWRLGGWDEERWCARYRQGLALLGMGQGERGAGVLLEAFDERPTRAEPLWALARHYRILGKNHAAFMMARRALDIPFPDDALFVERPVYEWQVWEEIMITAFYVGERHHDLGFRACERLRARRGHEAGFYNYVASNEVFYVRPLPALRRGGFSVPAEVRDRAGTEYHSTNPTIVRLGDRAHVNVRLLNYRQEGGNGHTPYCPDGIFRSRNATLDWDPDGDRQGAVRESRGVPDEWPVATRKHGLEDVRWVEHAGRVWFTAACYQAPASVDRCRVVLGRMNEGLDAVEHLVELRYAAAREMEKSWLLWPRGHELFVIYGYDPFLVLAVDPASGETSVAHSSTPPWRAADFRGSCCPVAIPGRPGRFVAMVHEVAYRQSGNVYTHRWIEIDERDGLVRRSRPFVFDHTGVEYAVGLCSLGDSSTGTLIVTYGFEDREARWIEVAWATVLESLMESDSEDDPTSNH